MKIKSMLLAFATLLLACLLSWHASINASFVFLNKLDGDGLVHMKQLLTVFEGICSADIIKAYSFNLNTGALYFFSHVLLGLPILLSKSSDALVYIPRLVNAVCAMAVIGFSYHIYKRYLSTGLAVLLSAFPLILPQFWKSMHFFKADLMMAAFLSASLYFLFKDERQFQKYFWIAITCFSFALGAKTQALVFYPLVFLYCFYDVLFRFELSLLKPSLMRFAKSIGLNLLIFVGINPFILHPVGFYAFFRRFFWQVQANHSSIYTEFIPLTVRFERLTREYLPLLLSALALLLIVYSLSKLFQKNSSFLQQMLGFVAFYSVLNTAYLVFISFFMDANWLLSYYFFLPFLAIPFLKKLEQKKALALVLGVFAVQLLLQHNAMLRYFSQHPILTDHQAKATINLIHNSIGDALHDDTYVLMDNRLSFNFFKYGLSYNNVIYTTTGLQDYHIYEEAFREKWKAIDLDKVKARVFYKKDFILLKKNEKNGNLALYEALITEQLQYKVIAENRDILILALKR